MTKKEVRRTREELEMQITDRERERDLAEWRRWAKGDNRTKYPIYPTSGGVETQCNPIETFERGLRKDVP
jgi:hypothetical protein